MMMKSLPQPVTTPNDEPEPQVTPTPSPGSGPRSASPTKSKQDRMPDLDILAEAAEGACDDRAATTPPSTTPLRNMSGSSAVSTCSVESVMSVNEKDGEVQTSRSNGSLRFESMSSVGTTSSCDNSNDNDADLSLEGVKADQVDDYNVMLEMLQSSSSQTKSTPKPSALPSPSPQRTRRVCESELRGAKRNRPDTKHGSTNSSPKRKKLAASTRKTSALSSLKKLARVQPRAPLKNRLTSKSKKPMTKSRMERSVSRGTSVRDPQAFQELASRNGGSFMRRGSHGKLIWRCARGHLFKRDLKSIREGKWCWPCTRQRDMQWRADAAALNDQLERQWREVAECEQEALFAGAKKRMVLVIEEERKQCVDCFGDVYTSRHTTTSRLNSTWSGQTTSPRDVEERTATLLSCDATPMDPFECLGLHPSAEAVVVKRRFKQLALKYHPDKNAAPGATNVFCAVSMAYRQIMRGQSN
jgi:hypothetical protein